MPRGIVFCCRPVVFQAECIVVCVGRCWPFDVMICCGFDFVFGLFYFHGGVVYFNQRVICFVVGPLFFKRRGLLFAFTLIGVDHLML